MCSGYVFWCCIEHVPRDVRHDSVEFHQSGYGRCRRHTFLKSHQWFLDRNAKLYIGSIFTRTMIDQHRRQVSTYNICFVPQCLTFRKSDRLDYDDLTSIVKKTYTCATRAYVKSDYHVTSYIIEFCKSFLNLQFPFFLTITFLLRG